MIRIAVVDDDIEYISCIRRYLDRYAQEHAEDLYITTFSDGDEIACNYKPNYDIILLDVEMRFMDGMMAAEEIRKVDSEVILIFITNMAQYAIRGYTVEAMDYVLKPISYFAFSQRIDRALGRLKNRKKRAFVIAQRGGGRRVEASQLYYVEVRNHELIYRTAEGVFTASGTMRDVEDALRGANFYRCSKGYLINLAHVDAFQNECVLVKGELVPVSRAKKRDFMDRLNDYLNEVAK